MKAYSLIHNIGLLLVLLTAFVKLVLLHHSLLLSLLFSMGVILITIGRFFGSESDYSLSKKDRSDLISRRLHRQRLVAVCILYLSVLLLFLPEGFYFGIYIRKSLWFLPLMIFTIIEVYTIFRLSSTENRNG